MDTQTGMKQGSGVAHSLITTVYRSGALIRTGAVMVVS